MPGAARVNGMFCTGLFLLFLEFLCRLKQAQGKHLTPVYFLTIYTKELRIGEFFSIDY
jgi:hypothetical protein